MHCKSSVSKYFLLFFLLIIFLITKGSCQTKVFVLEDFGAVSGGDKDNSKALLKAWDAACKWKGNSKLDISQTYLVNPVLLRGPCKGPIEFHNSGTLKAPLGLVGNSWIEFRYVDRLTVNGGGSFDGQSPPIRTTPKLSTMLSFTFVTNSYAQDVKITNSQGAHFILFGVNNTLVDKITISTPSNSHNTDGIKIGHSNGIIISNSNIASGDDCVALLTGSKNISIVGVNCGPGHGISIGSMGGSLNEQVQQVLMKNCKLSGTTNGLRIKTKLTDNPGFVSNIRYEDIIMNDVDNPIIFDQKYCVRGSCGTGSQSRIQISDVSFKNIRGTSKTKVAVNLQCSMSNPCKKIMLNDININYIVQQGRTISNCSYVSGNALGVQIPKPCISISQIS